MKRLLLLPLVLMLASCGPLLAGFAAPQIPPPVQIANATTLDEQGALGVELAYKAARIAIEVGVDAGLIKGERAARLAVIDDKAYAAVRVARRAYQAGNAADYVTALSQARLAIADLVALVK